MLSPADDSQHPAPAGNVRHLRRCARDSSPRTLGFPQDCGPTSSIRAGRRLVAGHEGARLALRRLRSLVSYAFVEHTPARGWCRRQISLGVKPATTIRRCLRFGGPSGHARGSRSDLPFMELITDLLQIVGTSRLLPFCAPPHLTLARSSWRGDTGVVTALPSTLLGSSLTDVHGESIAVVDGPGPSLLDRVVLARVPRQRGTFVLR
jgi:hypothetical protein